jgi:FtsZ-binding cell division protein ZapB
MQEREQIINYLLQSVDQKNVTIAQLQAQIAELKKKYESTSTEATPVA